MSSIWLFILFLILGTIGVIYYIISQMKETERLDPNAPNIVPGSLQVSKPSRKPPQRSAPTPTTKPTLASLDMQKEESPVDFLPPKKPSRGFKKLRLFKDKEDIRRSFIIDQLLNRKTK